MVSGHQFAAYHLLCGLRFRVNNHINKTYKKDSTYYYLNWSPNVQNQQSARFRNVVIRYPNWINYVSVDGDQQFTFQQ